MRKQLLAAFLFLLPFFITAQDFKQPVDYLKFISKETGPIATNTWKYTKAVAHSKSARRIESTRKGLVKSIENASKKIAAAENGYNGDVEYKDQLLAYLAISQKYINEEYDKIIDMQEVAEQSYDYMEAYITARELVNQKINDEVEKLNANQKVFANKYGIQITEDESELSKKMALSNEIFAHQSEMYLLFFKVYITDANLMKAVENNDLVSMQQNASVLEQYANEGLEKIKSAKSYKNDMVLINATKKTLEFYKKEALEFVPEVVNFMMMKQKMEDSQKAMEGKSSHSKEEVNNYNKLVSDFNKLIGSYNKLNAKYMQDKNKTIDAWNSASESYISKHVPND